MGAMPREEKSGGLQQQASLMFNEQVNSRKGASTTRCVQSEPEPPLPYGWEKCLDLKSGVFYFNDWNTGMQIYTDPRRNSNSPCDQRIGHLLISLQTKTKNEKDVAAETTVQDDSSDDIKISSRRRFKVLHSGLRMPLERAMIGRQSVEPEDSTSDLLSFDQQHQDWHSLKLSLNPPGANCSSREQQSVCTVEKVQNALKWSQWGGATRSVKRSQASSFDKSGKKCVSLTDSLSTSLALHSPPSRPSSSRESNSPGPRSEEASSKRSTPPSSLSQTCSSECLTSPSTIIQQGSFEEDEVQQPRSMFRELTTLVEVCRRTDTTVVAAATKENQVAVQQLQEVPDDAAVMVAVGCKSCLMYIMLPKLQPSCPKCGNAVVLLDLPSPKPKKQRRVLELSSTPKWNWLDAKPIAT